MTLMEVLVAMATVLVLIGALMGIGSYVRTRGNIDLTQSMLSVLTAALEQYYDDTSDFPFDTDVDGDGVLDNYLRDDLINDVSLSTGLGVSLNVTDLLEEDGIGNNVSAASSAALFYYLDKYPSSRSIAESVSNTLITNKHADGTVIKMTLDVTPYDLPRYIDAWKMSIRYEYLTGTAFPVLTSAGPDKVFDTPDDITSQ